MAAGFMMFMCLRACFVHVLRAARSSHKREREREVGKKTSRTREVEIKLPCHGVENVEIHE